MKKMLKMMVLGCGICLLVALGYHWGRGGGKSGANIGIVEVRGTIADAGEPIRQLKELEENGSVKAIVVRIDSPGGTVAPSQEIYDEIRRIRQSKKVVASMGAVAASGGYYVAAAADRIVANRGTLTGSIGVLIKVSNIQSLLQKLGVSMTTLKSAPLKAAGDPMALLTPEGQNSLQQLIEATHDQFVRDVAAGRGLSLERAKAVADGRVLTGEQAKRLGLVDVLGGQEEAVREAARLAGITGKPGIVKPKKAKKGLADMFERGRLVQLDEALAGLTGLLQPTTMLVE